MPRGAGPWWPAPYEQRLTPPIPSGLTFAWTAGQPNCWNPQPTTTSTRVGVPAMEIQIDSAPTRWNSGGGVLPRNTFLAAGDRHRPEATSLERTVAVASLLDSRDWFTKAEP